MEKAESKKFIVSIDYDRSIEESVKAGEYDWSNGLITAENFPTQRRGRVDIEIILVNFNEVHEDDDLIKKLDKLGLRPAELRELLAFGKSYPEMQRNFWIVSLDFTYRDINNCRRLPFLCDSYSFYHCSGSRPRHLNLTGKFHVVFDWNCRFVTVQKAPS